MIQTTGLTGRLFTGADLLYKAMYLQFLWILFTLLGLGIFGFMPATSAVFSTLRKWIDGETDISIFPFFLKTYKLSWKSSNLIGLVVLLIGIFLYADLKISQEYIKSVFVHYPLLIVSFIFAMTCLFLFPVYVHYELKPLQYIKQALYLLLLNPMCMFSIILWVLCAYIIFLYMPVIYLFMGITIVCFPIMWFCSLSFKKMEKKMNH